MEPIKLLPYNAGKVFEVYFLGWNPKDISTWHYDDKMKEHGINIINQITQNPSQLVQVVNSQDDFCEMCPQNKKGLSANENSSCPRIENINYQTDLPIAQMLGIEGLIGKSPITSEQLLHLMKPTYLKMHDEPNATHSGMKYSAIFRTKKK